MTIPVTNAIEALNSKLRRAVRTRGHFPNDDAAMKLLYLVLNHAPRIGNDLRASGSRPKPSSPSSSAKSSSANDETGLAHRIPDSPIGHRGPFPPFGNSLLVDPVPLRQRSQALLTMLYRSTNRLCRRGAPMKNLAHSASFDSDDDEPSKSGIKHLVGQPMGKIAPHFGEAVRSYVHCSSFAVCRKCTSIIIPPTLASRRGGGAATSWPAASHQIWQLLKNVERLSSTPVNEQRSTKPRPRTRYEDDLPCRRPANRLNRLTPEHAAFPEGSELIFREWCLPTGQRPAAKVERRPNPLLRL